MLWGGAAGTIPAWAGRGMSWEMWRHRCQTLVLVPGEVSAMDYPELEDDFNEAMGCEGYGEVEGYQERKPNSDE